MAPRFLWLLLAACGAPPRGPTPATTATVAPTPREDLDVTLSREVTTGGITYVFRASRIANLIYTLDCASGLARCSQPAYEDSLALDGDDRRALATWKTLHFHYTGQFVPREESSAPSPLPIISPVARGLVPHIRLAAYSADDIGGALDRMSLFLEPGDVAAAEQVIRRFEERTRKAFRERRAELRAKVDAFAALLQRKDVAEIVDRVARFYAPDLPPRTRETFEILARPQHDGGDHGEQLADHALVETRIEESANERVDVVLHELFHRWYASAAYDKKLALARAFASSHDPVALPAYGVLNEALATVFGNGLVARAVDRTDFEKRLREPLALYHDRFIDPTAKAILPWIDGYIAAGKTLYDPEFLSGYLPLVGGAFPKGIAPAMRLRPLVSAYEPGLEEVDQHLGDALNPGWSESDAFGAEARDALRKHALWGATVLVLAAHLEQVQGIETHIDAKAVARLRAEASKKSPFVLTLPRPPGEPLFILVAEDAPALRPLADRFAALEEPIPEVWR